MKAIHLILLGLIAGWALADSARAQDKTAAHYGVLTNSAETIYVPVDFKTGPALAFGPDRQATGLFVDLARPRQTWDLFNPLAPVPPVTRQIIDVPPPPVPHDMNGNLASHEGGLVLFKLSFR